MIYYFVAYYAEEKAYTYHAENNSFLPYSPIYRRRYSDSETAQAIARHARKKNRDKARYIFVDSAIAL